MHFLSVPKLKEIYLFCWAFLLFPKASICVCVRVGLSLERKAECNRRGGIFLSFWVWRKLLQKLLQYCTTRKAGDYPEAEMIQLIQLKRGFAFQIWLWYRTKMLSKYYSKEEIVRGDLIMLNFLPGYKVQMRGYKIEDKTLIFKAGRRGINLKLFHGVGKLGHGMVFPCTFWIPPILNTKYRQGKGCQFCVLLNERADLVKGNI